MRSIVKIIMILVIVVSASFCVYYQIPINNFFQVPSASNWLLLGVIAMEGGSFLIGQLLDRRNRVQERREKHTSELNEIYKRLCRIGYKTGNRNEVVFTVPRSYYMTTQLQSTSRVNRLTQSMPTSPNYNHLTRIGFDEMSIHPDYQDFDFAMEHLKYKKYENIYKHWENANKLIKEYVIAGNNPTKEALDKLNEELKLFSKELLVLVTQLKSRKIEGECAKCR